MLSGEMHAMFVTVASAQFRPGWPAEGARHFEHEGIDALPQVPTMVEAGFPGMVSGSWQGVFVPAGTPRPIVDKLHQALLAALGSAEIRERLVASGVPVVTSRTPDEFAAFIGAEVIRWGEVAKDSGAPWTSARQEAALNDDRSRRLRNHGSMPRTQSQDMQTGYFSYSRFPKSFRTPDSTGPFHTSWTV
jgi:hypothetical protein